MIKLYALYDAINFDVKKFFIDVKNIKNTELNNESEFLLEIFPTVIIFSEEI